MPGQQQRERDPPERLPRRRVQVGRGLLERAGPGSATRALTVTTTKLMQNMHVRGDDRAEARAGRAAMRNCASSAAPSTTSGVDIGRKISRLVSARPRNRNRTSAIASSVPSTVAIERSRRTPDLQRVDERLAHLRRAARVLPVVEREARATRGCVLPASLNENTTV